MITITFVHINIFDRGMTVHFMRHVKPKEIVNVLAHFWGHDILDLTFNAIGAHVSSDVVTTSKPNYGC